MPLIQFGFVSSKYDHSLFVYNHYNITFYAHMYVDDILITGSSSKLIHALINKFQTSLQSSGLLFLNILWALRFITKPMTLFSLHKPCTYVIF